MSNIYKYSLVVVAALVFVFFAAAGISPKVSAINLFGPNCNGNNVKGGNGAGSDVCASNKSHLGDTSGKNAALDTINAAANIVAGLGGVLAVIIIIIGGFRFVTTGGFPGGQRAGDTSGVKQARTMITNASIGLLIIAMAWTITRFIADRLL